MTPRTDPWRVVVAVVPALLQELLSEQLSRTDLRVSTLASLEPDVSSRRFDIAVLDGGFPTWLQADRFVRVGLADADDISPLPASGPAPTLDDVASIRHTLARLCPRRSMVLEMN